MSHEPHQENYLPGGAEPTTTIITIQTCQFTKSLERWQLYVRPVVLVLGINEDSIVGRLIGGII